METVAPVENNPKDFRDHLRLELQYRRARNPRYSLRAFARQLEMDPSRLSKILSGKKAIGRIFIQQVSEKLQLTSGDRARFLQFHCGTEDELPPRREFHPLPEAIFTALSDWVSIAILAMLNLEDFEPSAHWVARRLGIPRDQARVAVDRLLSLGLLIQTATGEWRDGTPGATTTLHAPHTTSRAQRTVLESLMQLSLKALREVPLEQRSHSYLMVSGCSHRIEGARRMIRDFQRELTAYLEGPGEKDTLFIFNGALFPAGPLRPPTETKTHA